MTITPFEIRLYEQLTPFFAKHGYSFISDRKQYRRRVDTGFQNVLLSTTFYEDEVMLEVNFGCRNEQVEQIAQQFLNNAIEYRADANTVILSIGKFSGFHYFRYKIHSSDELTLVCEQIESFFSQAGFDFLKSACSLASLDRLLNEQPNQPCLYVYNQTHRCYKGLIAARLNNNPRFDGLVDSYRHLLDRQTKNPYEQQHFERLVAYLRHYSAN